MKLYFSRVTADYWVPKNTLEAAAKKLAYEMDRQLVPENKVEVFKAKYRSRLQKLNEEHSRCKPLVLDIWTPDDRGTYRDKAVDIKSVVCMTLYEVNGDSMYELNFFEYKKL
jgi:hypothetical protein